MPTVYTTAPPEAAADPARILVEGRFAACVDRLPCVSTYHWEGAVREDEKEKVLPDFGEWIDEATQRSSDSTDSAPAE